MKTITINKFDASKVIVSMANKDYFLPMLENIAHRYYLDMLVVYKQILDSDEDGFTTRTILTEEVEEAGLTMAELDRIALDIQKTAGLYGATWEHVYDE